MEYRVTSDITGKKYDVRDSCKIVNIRQQTLYLKHGVPLLDMYVGKDFQNGGDIIVMVFSKEESRPFYEKWMQHELY